MICQNVPIDFDLDLCKWQGFGEDAVEALQELGFKTLIKRLPGLDKENEKPIKKGKQNLRLW